MKLKNILVIAAMTIALAAQAKLGSLNAVYASFDLQSLQPEDKALYDKAMEIEASDSYNLGCESVTTFDGTNPWEGNEDRLQVLRWFGAVDIAANQLGITDAMQVYRVSNLIYEYYCKQQGIAPPVADYILIEMVTMFCAIPLDENEGDYPQQDMNMISSSEATAKTFAVLRYFATCDWNVFDKTLLAQENQAWYELLLAYERFHVGCVMEGSMGPMILGGCISDLATAREELITIDQDIEDGLYQGNDESYYEKSKQVDDKEFLADIKEIADSELGWEKDPAKRKALYDAFVASWQKWVAARNKVEQASLAGKHPMARDAYHDGVNRYRLQLLKSNHPLADEEDL